MFCLMKHNIDNEKNLRISLSNGVLASVMSGLTSDFFVPFLLFLGATASQIGLLNGLPNLAAAFVQLKSATLTKVLNGRKRVILFSICGQLLVLSVLVAAAWCRCVSIETLIGVVILFTCFGALAAPAWGSLLSEFVDHNERGRYFGYRNRVLGFVQVGSGVGAGLLLYASPHNGAGIGFAVLFCIAFCARLFSLLFALKISEPAVHESLSDFFTFSDFIKRFKKSNFTKFVFLVSGMSFCVNIVSPFFSVLMLKGLGFDYLTYTVLMFSSTIMIFGWQKRWGIFADTVGNVKVLRLTSLLIAVLPALWLISRHPLYLFIIQMFAGFVWAGYNISSSNFIYDAVSPAKRVRCISYFNVINGVSLCAGSLLGAFLVSRVPPLMGNKILFLCVVSSIARFAAAFFGFSHIQEVRQVKDISSYELFVSAVGIKAVPGVQRKLLRFSDPV